MKSSLSIRAAFALTLLAVALLGYILVLFAQPLTAVDRCNGGFVAVLESDGKDVFRACLTDAAKRFVNGEYAQTKELASTFFTLCTAVLVLSLTFSDKIVGLETAPKHAFLAIVFCWSLFAGSILITGGALSVMVRAASIASQYPWADYRWLKVHSTILFSFATLLFATGLLLLMFAAVSSLTERRNQRAATEA